MAVRAVRALNRELPHADIYLNDLWEIEEIFRNGYLKIDNKAVIAFNYRIDNLDITTREELQAHGGRATHFSLELTESTLGFSTRDRVLSFYGYSKPKLDIPYRISDSEWELHGRVNAIFSERKKRYKNFVVQIPLWVFSGILVLLLFLLNLFHITPKNDLPLDLIVVGCYLWVISYTKNWVYLQSSRDDERTRITRRSERIEKLFWLVVGAGLGIASTILTNHYKH